MTTALIDTDIVIYQIAAVADEFVSRRKVRNKVDHLINFITEESESDKYCCYLSPRDSSNNFRTNVATVKKYKGNRNQEKPFHFWYIRDYIEDSHPCKISEWREADDELADDHHKIDSVICSRDKDMLTKPGLHYIWPVGNTLQHAPHKPFYVNVHEADRFFWYQMLVGDTVDNIMGAYGIGEARANKLLNATDRDMYKSMVSQVYYTLYGNAISYQTWWGEWVTKSSEEIFTEMWWLLNIGGQDKDTIDFLFPRRNI